MTNIFRNVEAQLKATLESLSEEGLLPAGLDLYRFGGFDIPDLARKSFNLTFRALADRVNGFQIGTNGRHFQTGNSLNQIEPMGADVGDSTQSTAFLSQHTPVVIIG